MFLHNFLDIWSTVTVTVFISLSANSNICVSSVVISIDRLSLLITGCIFLLACMHCNF